MKDVRELPLTYGELKVVQELLKDKTNQQIADSLHISRRTVEYHITSAIQKLGVNSRVGLVIKMMDCYRPFCRSTDASDYSLKGDVTDL